MFQDIFYTDTSLQLACRKKSISLNEYSVGGHKLLKIKQNSVVGHGGNFTVGCTMTPPYTGESEITSFTNKYLQ